MPETNDAPTQGTLSQLDTPIAVGLVVGGALLVLALLRAGFAGVLIRLDGS